MSYEISIVIPYFNKLYELNLILKALSLQNYPMQSVEIVIVDDGSEVNPDNIIQTYRNRLNISYLHLEHTGNRGRNRNFGVDKSCGGRIVFLDGDIIPDRNLLLQFDNDTKGDTKKVSVGLRYLLNKFEKDYITEDVIENHFEIIRNMPGMLDYRLMPINYQEKTQLEMDGKWQLLYTNCLCLWKKEFQEVQGFDGLFCKNWGAEDIELGYKLFRNGCNIKVNNNICTYHVFHPENVFERIVSLKKNYDIFVKKHQHWSVELFIREYESWAIVMIDIQEKIKARKHILQKISNFSDILIGLEQNSIIFGIENVELLNSDKVVKAFIPESTYNHPKIQNLIGIRTIHKDKEFNVAIISDKYREVNLGMFDCLLIEADRIAKKILIVSDGKSNTDTYSEVSLPKNKKYLSFLLSNNFDYFNNYTKHNFINLSIAAKKKGVNVGIDLGYDPTKERNINSGFLKVENTSEARMIDELYNHQLAFIGDYFPCIIDEEMIRATAKAIGYRYIWSELSYHNEDKFLNDLKPFANHFITKRESERKFYNKDVDVAVLPSGINSNKIRRMRKSHECTDSVFTFLWADKHTGSISNLDKIVQAFIELFKNNKNVKLKIVYSGNAIEYRDFELIPNILNKLYKERNVYWKYFHDDYLSKVKGLIKNESNITFKTELTEEGYLKEIADCNCYINLNSNLKINPLVLYSIGFGKKPIVLNNYTYDEYSAGNVIKVTCKKESALDGEPFFEPFVSSVNNRRMYLLKDTPDIESLKHSMITVYENRDVVDIGELFVENFQNEFDWDYIAERLINILY